MNNKEQILKILKNEDRAVIFSFRDLRFAFGHKRIDGLTMAFIKAFRPSAREEDHSYLSPHEIHNNIEDWCRENNVFYDYDYDKDEYKLCIR